MLHSRGSYAPLAPTDRKADVQDSDEEDYATLLHENGNSLHTIQNLMIHLHPGTTAQYICNSDALARKAADSLHLQPSRLKRLLSKVKELFR